MSVTLVTEDWRNLGINTEVGLQGASGSMTRRFQVEFNAADPPSYRPILALNASYGGVSVPDYWEPHPADNNFFVRRKSVAPDGSPFLWAVTVEYEYIENPLEQPYSVQFIPQGAMETIDRAINPATGEWTIELCNSSKEPFDPPVQEEAFDLGIIIRRNESAIDFKNKLMAVYYLYLNSVNSDVFKIFVGNEMTDRWGRPYLLEFPAQKVLCKSIQAEQQRCGDLFYFVVQYEFIFRSDGWKRRLLDIGFREIVNGKEQQIVDEEGNPVTQPVKLNGAGQRLSPNATPVWLEFQTKQYRPFSVFGFDYGVQTPKR